MIERKIKIGLVVVLLAGLWFMVSAPPALAADNSVTITSPNGGEYWAGTQSITWTVEANDSTNDTFWIGYYNTSMALYWMNTSLPSTSTSYSWDTTGATDKATFKVRVAKNNSYHLDNVTDESNAVFTVDNTNPSVTITGSSAGLGTDDRIYTHASTLDFSGTCSDATSGVKNVSVAGTAGTVSGSTWSVSSASVSADCNVVTATLYDNAGNSATDTTIVCRSATKTGSSYVPPTGGEASPFKSILTIIPSGEGIAQGLSGLKGIGIIALILLVIIVVLLREKK